MSFIRKLNLALLLGHPLENTDNWNLFFGLKTEHIDRLKWEKILQTVILG